ncbi:putative Arv1-like protein [Hibiscus syriacus]|uniref:Arv1-like protein n=1 Tax=Hibiscus syriacus TaxID=106335 RepID=A0A6A3AZN7_HIBSY|nr:NAC domain-containing protein 4-like [Hibiscus syriacus]KAE8708259.1 putative Arv1-like protein [Hibiscus syriacus]
MNMKHVKGFRFHPTDEEAMEHLWEKQVLDRDSFAQVCDSRVPLITQLEDICKFEPQELPVWYFFCTPRYKYRNSKRKNRVTKKGYWNPTGKPREIVTTFDGKKISGTKQTMVFYKGRVGDKNKKENKTPWLMLELELTLNLPNQKSLTLCKLKKKARKVDVSRGEEGQSNLCLPSNLESHCTNSAIPEGQLNSREPLTGPVSFTENSGIQSELVNNEQTLDEFVDTLIKNDEFYSNQPTFPYEKEDSMKLKAPNDCVPAMNQVGISDHDNSSRSSVVYANDPTNSNEDDNQQNTLFAEENGDDNQQNALFAEENGDDNQHNTLFPEENGDDNQQNALFAEENGDDNQHNTSFPEEGSRLAFENHVPVDSIPTEGSDFNEFFHNGIQYYEHHILIKTHSNAPLDPLSCPT